MRCAVRTQSLLSLVKFEDLVMHFSSALYPLLVRSRQMEDKAVKPGRARPAPLPTGAGSRSKAVKHQRVKGPWQRRRRKRSEIVSLTKFSERIVTLLSSRLRTRNRFLSLTHLPIPPPGTPPTPAGRACFEDGGPYTSTYRDLEDKRAYASNLSPSLAWVLARSATMLMTRCPSEKQARGPWALRLWLLFPR